MLSKAPYQRGRARRWLIFGPLALLLVGILAFRVTAPRLIHRWAQGALTEQLGEGAVLGDVDLSLIKMEIIFEQLALPAPAGHAEPTLFSFKALSFDLASLRRLANGDARLANIQVQGPRLALVTRPNGQLNLSGLFPPKGEVSRRAPEMSRFRFERVRIEDGALSWHDRRFSPPVVTVLSDVNLEIADLRSPMPPQTMDTEVSASALLGDAPVQASSRGNYLAVLGPDFDLDLSLHGLDATHFASRLGPDSPIEIASGEVDVALTGTCRAGDLDMVMELSFRDFEVCWSENVRIVDRALDRTTQAVMAYLHSDRAREPIAVPIRGNLTNPQFDLRDVTRASIRQSVIGRVRSLVDSGELVVRSTVDLGRGVARIPSATAQRVIEGGRTLTGRSVESAGRRVRDGASEIGARAVRGAGRISPGETRGTMATEERATPPK